MRTKLFLAAALLASLALSACSDKEHQCKCVPEDGDDTHLEILFAGPGVKCEDITETAFEERIMSEDGTHTLRRTEVHKVNCRDYKLND